MKTCLYLAAVSAGAKSLLMSFLWMLLTLVLIGVLFFAIEKVFGLPAGIRPWVGAVLLILVAIWAVMNFL